MAAPRITVLAGGVGGAKFVRGVRALLRDRLPGTDTAESLTVVVNTGDDAWVTGVRVTPDLDSVMYALAGVNDESRGWGRAGETERVGAELAAFGVGWPWFTLGDLDLGTCLARTSLLRDGLPLSAVVERLTARWPLGARLLPATDDALETHVEVEEDGEVRLLHFEEWWVRTRAALPARRFAQVGTDSPAPAPGVVDAIRDADVVLVAPSNPVVSIGTMTGGFGTPGIAGLAAALRETAAPVVGLSPVIAGAAVRGMADACLGALGTATDAAAVGLRYGARERRGLIDGWLVDEADSASLPTLAAAGLAAAAAPLWMHDDTATAAMAARALELADSLR